MHVLLNPRQHLLDSRNDLGGILKARVIDKVLGINHSDSMADQPSSPVASSEGWVAEVPDYLQNHQRVHKGLCDCPWSTVPSTHPEFILKESDECFPGLILGDEI